MVLHYLPVLRELVDSNAYPATRLSTFVQMLRNKCLLYGKELVLLDECDTSKQCSGYVYKQAISLWKRTYLCNEGGLIMDRADNSAVNILMRFLARRGHTQPMLRGVWAFSPEWICN